MLALLKRYRELLLVAVLLVVPLGVYFAHAKRQDELSWLDRAILTVTGPIERAIGWTVTGVIDGWNGYIALRHAHDRAEGLSRQVRDLEMERRQLLQLKDENDRLLQLLSLIRSVPENKYLGARVVGVQLDPKGLQVVTIDKGSVDGVSKMMPVVVARGVVGRVHSVLRWSSAVMLVVDRNSSIAVRVERSRARANVRGLNKPDVCALDYALRSEDMVEGDLLVTSGTDGVFPRGLSVGRVTNLKKTGHGLYQLADVIPAVDVTKIEEVLVVTSSYRISGEASPSTQAP